MKLVTVVNQLGLGLANGLNSSKRTKLRPWLFRLPRQTYSHWSSSLVQVFRVFELWWSSAVTSLGIRDRQGPSAEAIRSRGFEFHGAAHKAEAAVGKQACQL